MVARTTPARRAISDMLASWSSASASTAASRMRAMLRSASARRRGRDSSTGWWEAVSVVLVDGDARSEPRLRQEVRGRGKREQGDHAGGRGNDPGDQERVAEAVREARGRGSRSDGAGGDGDEDRDAQGAADLVAGRV